MNFMNPYPPSVCIIFEPNAAPMVGFDRSSNESCRNLSSRHVFPDPASPNMTTLQGLALRILPTLSILQILHTMRLNKNETKNDFATITDFPAPRVECLWSEVYLSPLAAPGH